MRNPIALALGFLAVAFVDVCLSADEAEMIWPLPNGPGNQNRSKYAAVPIGKVLWNVPLGHFVTGPVIDADGNLYCGTNNGKLASISPEGKIRWVRQFGSNVSRPTLVARDRVAAGLADGRLVCFSGGGEELWSFAGGESRRTLPEANHGPAVDAKGSILFTPDTAFREKGKSQVFCLSPDGALRWSFEIDKAEPQGAEFPARPIASCSLVLAAGAGLFFAGPDEAVYGLSEDGKKRWRLLVPGLERECAPCLHGGNGLLVGSRNGELRKLDFDGSLLWKCDATGLFPPDEGGKEAGRTPSHVFQSLAAQEDGGIVAAVQRRSWDLQYDCRVAAIAPDGRLLWNCRAGRGLCGDLAIDAAGRIHFGTYGGYALHCLDANGRLLGKMKFRDGVFSPVIGKNGTVYVGTGCCEDGLHAIRGTSLK